MKKYMVAALLIIGCAGSKEQRIQEIRSAYPQWDSTTVEQVAAHQVVSGMTPEMVVASLRKPDSVSDLENGEKWGYAVPRDYNMGAIYQKFVYFIYFVDGKVVKTEGDRKALGYWR